MSTTSPKVSSCRISSSVSLTKLTTRIMSTPFASAKHRAAGARDTRRHVRVWGYVPGRGLDLPPGVPSPEVKSAWPWLAGGASAIGIGLAIWFTAFVLVPAGVVLFVVGITKLMRSETSASQRPN